MCCLEDDDMSIEKEMLDELNNYLNSKAPSEFNKNCDNDVSLESFFED